MAERRTKRSHGMGTRILQRKSDQLFYAALTDPNTSKRLWFYGKTERIVRDKLTTARREIAAGRAAVPERMRLDAYLAQWLTTVKPSVRASTWLRYEQIVRLHLAGPERHQPRQQHAAPQRAPHSATAVTGSDAASTARSSGPSCRMG